ncbi:rna-binding glycine-rich protein [Plasmopara halstedii]|uniref:Rna-binding glycine-rich protein n=1 Tax=Plasmopara halstedii TaxID=4781 RepID=A0A0P1APS3_PLAHL|nr:rna-binding glycine-rich protein [Plasmopara halstedii]CEG43509.1 rna-binding glycine-rich protein [Plasmopara halstedii]|eukprot:XP_024579878.1 rna-binding glycine-rich protein [Plasmopara halstedii]
MRQALIRTLRLNATKASLAGVQCRMKSTHVSVVGLHWKTDETRLREVFAEFGTLEDAKLVKPDHSYMHLWAYLVYSTFDEALEAAIEMNGQELDGRLLRVSIVDPPEEDD